MTIQVICPACGDRQNAPFTVPCPTCGFAIDHLTGIKLSDYQKKKRGEHDDLLHGRSIELHGKEYNASFDHNGDASLLDLLRFTISFGHRSVLPSSRGHYMNPVIVAYTPEVIGSGTSIYTPGLLPCSGICVVSPASYEFGHPYPVIQDWVQTTFGSIRTTCPYCGKPTEFGQPFCPECYAAMGDWRTLL